MGFVGYPLAICSVILFGVLIERISYFISYSTKMNKIYAELEAILLQNKDNAKATRDEIISSLLSEQASYLRSGIKWLRMIGTLAPLIGLLGTITGLIKAFIKISETHEAVNPAFIADGLWEAMLTTAFGLGIAIPALILVHLFKFYSDGLILCLTKRLNKKSLELEGVKI